MTKRRVKFTDVAIRNLKPQHEGVVEYWDTHMPGFGIRVTPMGIKAWQMVGRVNGKPLRLGLGRYPKVSLATARDLARDNEQLIQRGVDPRDEKKRRIQEAERQRRETERAREGTVANVADVFIERYCKQPKKNGQERRSWPETKRILDRYILPQWGGHLITDIRRADVAFLLDHVEDNHGVYMTNRVLAVIRKMFNWAVDERGLLDASPVGRNMARGGEKARSRFLSVEEIRLLWPVLDQQAYPFGLFAKLLLVTGQRRNEVAAMQWAELNDEPTVWIIPAERMKSGRDHEVPLSTMAQNLLGAIPRVDDKYVFSTKAGRPVSGFSQAKKWVDRHIEAAERTGSEFMEPWRYHDLRATVATQMAEALALPPHVVGAVLGHDPRLHAGITATYQRGSMHQAKRDALEAWGSLLHKVVTKNG